jgi:hypothetical protein
MHITRQDIMYRFGYDEVGPFDKYSDGLACARIRNKWFHIEMDGEPLYEERYTDIKSFDGENETSVNQGGKWFHIDRQGKPLYEERYDGVTSFGDAGIAYGRLGDTWTSIYKDRRF